MLNHALFDCLCKWNEQSTHAPTLSQVLCKFCGCKGVSNIMPAIMDFRDNWSDIAELNGMSFERLKAYIEDMIFAQNDPRVDFEIISYENCNGSMDVRFEINNGRNYGGNKIYITVDWYVDEE